MSYYLHVLHRDILLKQNCTSHMQLPTFSKGILHSSTKSATTNKKNILPALVALQLLSAQKPKITRAKKPIASFRLRKDQLLGCSVTLRKHLLKNFLYTLITCVLPRMRELPSMHATSNTLSFGLSNALLFPELENLYELYGNFGLEITLVSSLRHSKDSPFSLLLSGFQFPLKSHA